MHKNFQDALSSIQIILSRTLHPGNIGSVARAMKTMGLQSLILVSPCEFSADRGMAKAMAAGAENILRQAQIYPDLDSAVGQCQLLIGTSARTRGLDWPLLNPREMAELVVNEDSRGTAPIGLLFGCENSGLTNEELQRCHYSVHIPANSEYSSLNLAAAVQIMTYELRMAFLSQAANPLLPQPASASESAAPLCSMEDMEQYFKHLEEVLYQIDFIDPKQPRKLLHRLRRIYMRAGLDKVEMNILRGILTETQRSLGKK